MITSFSLLVHVYLVHMNQMEFLHFLPRLRRGRAFASHTGDRGSIPGRDRHNLSRKIGIDSSTAKRSATSVSVTGPRRWPLGSCRSGCVTLKNPHCSMAMSTEQRSPAIVTSPYEWKILQREQTNKQIYFFYYKNIDISRSSQSYCYLWLLYILQFTRMHLLFK